MSSAGEILQAGVELRQLTPHPDDRGVFLEMFRRCWCPDHEFIQWNCVHSRANTLRGVHVHLVHDDYLLMVAGAARIGLCDLRRQSPTFLRGGIVSLEAANPASIRIPHGVAHGFMFRVESTHIYAVTQYWNLADELGCRWDDAGLNLDWGVRDPHLSERDRDAQSLAELLDQLEPHQDGSLAWQPPDE